MGSWVSKLVAGAHFPPSEKELSVRHARLRPEEELEQHACVDIPAPDTVTAPILLYPANVAEEVSDMRSPALERQSEKQDEIGCPAISSSLSTSEQSGRQREMSNHLAEISSSQSTMDIVNTQQRNEESRNDSRHPPLSLENENQEREFKTGRKFAYWSGSISFTGAMGLIGARVGNLALNIKKLPFYTCSTSMGSAFIISMLLLTFTTVCPAPRNSKAIVKFTQCLILGLFILAIGFGLAMIF